MSRRIIVIIIAAVLIGMGAVLWQIRTCDAADGSCGTASRTATTAPRAETISTEVSAGRALLIDVREPNEYAAGHAKGATLTTLADVEAGKLNESDKNKKIYLYCHSGRRAGLAKTALEKQGYTNVESLGGLSSWEAIGGKVER